MLASIEPSAGADGDLQLVHHLVTGQGGVIGLEVELEVRHQVVGPQEVEAGRGVRVVLVLGRLLRLGLDVEGAGEADLLLVIHGHVEEAGHVVELPLHVGVQERRVALASPPEGIAGTAQLVRQLERLLDLRGGVGEGVEIRAGGRAVHVAGVGEEVGRPPEQLDARAALLVLQNLDHLVEVRVALLERLALGGDVAVVEGIEGDAELLEELERGVDLTLRISDRAAAVVPGTHRRAHAERVRQRVAERVPVDNREPQVLLERLASDDLVRNVIPELQRVERARTAIGDLGDVGEELGHRRLSPIEELEMTGSSDKPASLKPQVARDNPPPHPGQ